MKRFKWLYGIDIYADHHDLDEYKSALKRLGWKNEERRYVLLRMSFNAALDLFEDNTLDLVYYRWLCASRTKWRSDNLWLVQQGEGRRGAC